MKKAIKTLQCAYPDIEIRPFAGLGHGSIMDYPELFKEEIEKFIQNKINL